MKGYPEIENILKELGIDFELAEHAPAYTTEEADAYIEGIEGVRTKTMFLTNRKKTDFYMLIMDDSKRLDMNSFRDIVGANKIKLASPESLFEKIQLPPGVVSPFGLLNNPEKDIKIYFDKEIMSEERLSFHPNTNEKTIFVKTDDILKFLIHIGYNPIIVVL